MIYALPLLLSLFFAPAAVEPVPVAAEEIVLLWPDGTVRARYGVDDQGRNHGTYVEYHENGKLALKTRYRTDRLEGSYQTFFDNGKREITTTYKKGVLHGKYEEREEGGSVCVAGKYKKGKREGTFEYFEGKERLSRQLWEEDRLVDLDGIVPYPRTREEIAAVLDEIYGPESSWPPEPTEHQTKSVPGDAEADLDDDQRVEQDLDREAALERLMAYRYLSGLAWRDMELDAAYNYYASMAARLLRVIGRLDHTPANPGLPEEEYKHGYKGTSSSNLAVGSSLCSSIDSYMNDSDESNIDRVGHRNWCLNPSMQRTGFGKRERFSAMWSFDGSRKKVPDWDTIPYPAPGWYPIEYFGNRHAWSIRLNPNRFRPPKSDELKIEIRQLDDDFVPMGEPLELDHLGVRGHLMIFRPKEIAVLPGYRYRLEITGLKGTKKTDRIEFMVEFVTLDSESE